MTLATWAAQGNVKNAVVRCAELIKIYPATATKHSPEGCEYLCSLCLSVSKFIFQVISLCPVWSHNCSLKPRKPDYLVQTILGIYIGTSSCKTVAEYSDLQFDIGWIKP